MEVGKGMDPEGSWGGQGVWGQTGLRYATQWGQQGAVEGRQRFVFGQQLQGCMIGQDYAQDSQCVEMGAMGMVGMGQHMQDFGVQQPWGTAMGWGQMGGNIMADPY